MYDIGLPELEITERTTDENNDCSYQATVKTSPTKCPECGSAHIVKHKKHDRMVRDLNEYEILEGCKISNLEDVFPLPSQIENINFKK